VDSFLPKFSLLKQWQLEHTVFSPEGYGELSQSLRRGIEYDHDDPTERYGILSAKFRKRISTDV
jgi:hypothetical protein